MRVVTYCSHLSEPRAQLGVFGSLAAALAAAAVVPCDDRRCLGVHIVCWREQRRMRCTIVDDHRRVRSRQRAFALAYPRPPLEPPLQKWSRPTSYNETPGEEHTMLPRKPTIRPCPDCGYFGAVEGHGPGCVNAGVIRRKQDAAVAATADRELSPYPGGTSARAAAEHDLAQTLKHRPDAHQYRGEIVGSEMSAKALSDAALVERGDE